TDGGDNSSHVAHRYCAQGNYRRQVNLRAASRVGGRRLAGRHTCLVAARRLCNMAAESIINRKALRDYHVLERYEAGIELKGSEVKSVRAGKANINDAFARVENREAFLYNAHIQPYEKASHEILPAKRIRKLLLQRQHIDK